MEARAAQSSSTIKVESRWEVFQAERTFVWTSLLPFVREKYLLSRCPPSIDNDQDKRTYFSSRCRKHKIQASLPPKPKPNTHGQHSTYNCAPCHHESPRKAGSLATVNLEDHRHCTRSECSISIRPVSLLFRLRSYCDAPPLSESSFPDAVIGSMALQQRAFFSRRSS